MWVTTKPQIPAEIMDEDNLINGEGYQISLNKEWKKVSPYKEESLLKRSLTGTKFINKSLNSSIIILMVPNGKSGDDYSLYEFSKSATQNYKIRSTSVYTMGENFNQLIEHSCQNKTFLLLLDCPKNIYEENKRLFESIIKSFYIDC
jgi:hypothetical protein